MKTLLGVLLLCGSVWAADAPPQRVINAKRVFLDTDVEDGTTLEKRDYQQYVHTLLANSGRYEMAERRSEADIEIFFRVSRFDSHETVKHSGAQIKNILPCVLVQVYDPLGGDKAKPLWGFIFVSSYFWIDATAGSAADMFKDIDAAKATSSASPQQ